MAESENDKELPAIPESRVSRIKRIIDALSDFEQDELAAAIQVRKMQEYQVRVTEPKNLFALCLHTGIWSGAFFGFFMGLICGVAGLYTGGVMPGIGLFFGILFLGGGVFGTFMGLYMMLLMRLTAWSIKRNLLPDQSNLLFQTRKVELPVSAIEGLEVCVTAIGSKKGWRMESINRQEGTVRAMTSPSFRSPGELVGVKVEPITESSSMVSIYSKVVFTAIDFGKNKQNVTLLAKEIEEAGVVHSILKLQ